MIHQVSAQVGSNPIVIETGKLAKLADGAVTIRSGETIIMVSAVSAVLKSVSSRNGPMSRLWDAVDCLR